MKNEETLELPLNTMENYNLQKPFNSDSKIIITKNKSVIKL
jgi:hypothetical protein